MRRFVVIFDTGTPFNDRYARRFGQICEGTAFLCEANLISISFDLVTLHLLGLKTGVAAFSIAVFFYSHVFMSYDAFPVM